MCKRFLFKIVLIVLYSCSVVNNSYAEIRAIVCDLGYFLIEPDLGPYMWAMGPVDVSIYAFSVGPLTVKNKVKSKVYKVLTTIGGKQDGKPEHLLCDYDGIALPQIFADWQLGNCTAQSICDAADKQLKILHKKKFFISEYEYRVIKKSIHAIFNPKLLAKVMYTAEGAKFVQKLAQERDESGRQKYTFYLFSNADGESFPDILFRPEFIENFWCYFNPKNIMISAHHHMAKPHPDFYIFFLETYNLKPEECLFIDDQESNLRTAKEMGFHVLLWNEKNSKRILKKISKRGVVALEDLLVDDEN